MSKLNGKKPFKDKHYQHKETGVVVKVVNWSEVTNSVALMKEDGTPDRAPLSNFYTYYGRVKDYVPPFRSELENK